MGRQIPHNFRELQYAWLFQRYKPDFGSVDAVYADIKTLMAIEDGVTPDITITTQPTTLPVILDAHHPTPTQSSGYAVTCVTSSSMIGKALSAVETFVIGTPGRTRSASSRIEHPN